MKENKIFKFLKSIIITLGGGLLIGLISNTSNYNSFVPAIIFPIVWTILYTLMGISSYLVSENGGNLLIYYLQLIINFLWPPIYFNLNLKFLALLIIILLIIIVINMINYFKEYNVIAAKIQIPYLLWLVFALFLNITAIISN